MKKERINITPDKTLYSKLGQTGYSVSEAISEFVDNSIDARIDGKVVRVVIEINLKKKRIIIEDDGVGMNKNEAIQSIKLASSQKKEKLGHFGLGLKTAAMSLGKKFTIETKQKERDTKYILIFDEDEFLENRDWDDFDIYTKNVGQRNNSGTRVTIENLKVSIHNLTIIKVKKQLQDRFSSYLLNKEVCMKVNGDSLVAERPKIIQKTKKDHIIKLSNGKKVKLWTAILKKGSQANSGFNLYRRGRLIRANEKLGYSYHPSKMWITGEIGLDNIPVTHNKREFITADPLYVEFFEKFAELIKPILKEAQQRHREKKIEDLTQEIKETLKDSLLKAINGVDDFQELAFPSADIPTRQSDKLGTLFEKEKRTSKKNIIEILESKKEEKETHQKRTPRKVQPEKKRFIVIAGQKYQFDYEWQEIEEDVPKVSYIDRDAKKIIIILNSRFSALNIISGDQSFYISLYVAEGIAEEVLKENSRPLEKVLDLRDKVIKKLADILSEDIGEKDYTKREKEDDAKVLLFKSELEKKEIKGISKRENTILRLRFGVNGKRHTLQEIAKKFNLTRERIRQIENKAISKLAEDKDRF